MKPSHLAIFFLFGGFLSPLLAIAEDGAEKGITETSDKQAAAIKDQIAQPKPPPDPDNYDQGKSNYYLQSARDQAELAQKVKASLPAHMQDFIAKYERVKWYKDLDALEAIIHPASKACENERNKAFFDYMRDFYLNESLPRGYRLQIMPVDKQKQWALKERLGFPLPPTHILFMEFKIDKHIEGLQRFLVEETYPEPRMYELVKCPDDETLRQFEAGEGRMDFHDK